MEGNFELNHIGYYTPILVEENTWLNDKQTPADLAKFGHNYSVVFAGDAQSYLWTTKTKPELNKPYYGHLQATSGKSIRFKTDKPEDTPQSGQSPSGGPYEAHSDKEDSIARAVSLKAAVEFVIGNGDPKLTVLDVADQYLTWLKNSGSPRSREGTPPQVTQASQNPDSAVGQKRDWSKVGQGEPLPLPPDDINDIEPGDYQ